MRSPSELKNFVFDDCLKDYLELYHSLPPVQGSFRRKPRINLEIIASQLKTTPQYLHFNLHCSNHRYTGVIPCAIDKESLEQLYKPTLAKMNRSSPTHYIVVPSLTQSSTNWIYTKHKEMYHKVKKFIYRELLSYHLNIPIVEVGLLDYDGRTFSEEYLHFDDIQNTIDKAIAWLNLVEAEGGLWTLENPPHIKMMPNLGLPYPDQYTETREKLAWQWRDVGLLYWVGPSTKADMHRRNIFTLDHPHIRTYLLTNHMHETQTAMLERMFLPVQPMSVEWKPTDAYSNFAYLDIETTQDSTNPSVTMCHIVGIVYRTQDGYEYKSFVSRDSSSIVESAEWMRSMIPNHTIVHYTHADRPAVPTGMASLDLYDDVRRDFLSSESLKALNLNNFKLKGLYKRMCERLQLPNLYDGCLVKNGLQAMYNLERYVDDEDGVADVIKYNRVDCLALALLHQYLLQEFDEKLKEQLC